MNKKLTLLFIVLLVFLNKLHSQQIIQLEGKYALMNRSNVVVASAYDSIILDKETYDDDDPMYLFYKNRKANFLFRSDFETTDWSNFKCSYIFLKPVKTKNTTAISFIVRESEKYGVIDENKVFMVPPILDTAYQAEKSPSTLIVRKGSKLDFLDVILDVDTPKDLTFSYDEINLDLKRIGLIQLRIGNKYGLYYNSFEGNKYVRGFVDVVYDSVFKPNGYLLSSFIKKQQHYLYLPSRIIRVDDFYEFELYFSDSTVFTDIRENKSTIFKGKNRFEKVLFSCPNLFIDYLNPNGFTTINLYKDEINNTFDQSQNASYDFVKIKFTDDPSNPEKTYTSLFYWKRVDQGDKIVETIYSIDYNIVEIYTKVLKANQQLTFKPLSYNKEYMQVLTVSTEKNSNGKVKQYGCDGYYSGFYHRLEKQKPTSSDEFKLFNGGGGGGNKKWMDIIWMGGR